MEENFISTFTVSLVPNPNDYSSLLLEQSAAVQAQEVELLMSKQLSLCSHL